MSIRGRWIAYACLAVAITAMAALPYLFPLSAFIPDLERAIAQRIHQPVSIGGLRLFVLPLPHLRANTVSIGRNGLLEVDSITIYPSFMTLLGDTKVIREVEVRGVHARFELLAAARNLINVEAAQSKRETSREHSRVRVDRVTLRDVSLRFPSFALSALAADIKLQDGKPGEIRATHQRDRLHLFARRQGDTWKLDIFARNWKLPVGLPLQFDRLEGTAALTASGIESRQLSGLAYGGGLRGPVRGSLASGYTVEGQLQIGNMELARHG